MKQCAKLNQKAFNLCMMITVQTISQMEKIKLKTLTKVENSQLLEGLLMPRILSLAFNLFVKCQSGRASDQEYIVTTALENINITCKAET